MKTAELAAKLGATIVTGKAGIDKEIKVYTAVTC